MKNMHLILVAVCLEHLDTGNAQVRQHQAVEIARHLAAQVRNFPVAADIHLAQFYGVHLELRRLKKSDQYSTRKLFGTTKCALRAAQYFNHMRKERPIEWPADRGQIFD